MAKADLKVIGLKGIMPRYVVAGGTKIEFGEPVHNLASYDNDGLADVNSIVLAAADIPVIGTSNFCGVSNKTSTVVAAGTIAEQWLPCALPVPDIGRIRGLGSTQASVDTLTELALLIMDKALITYNATGGADGGEGYTIAVTPAADVNGLTIVGGNTNLKTLDVIVDARAYCMDVT
jgi:hypothetical protein